MPALTEIQHDLAECLRSGLVTNNSVHVRTFEDRLHQYLGCTLKPSLHCNGELALYNLIHAWKTKLGYGPHESFEVLVPSFTFSGTINAVVANNLKPVFCDVDEGLVLDLDKLDVDSKEIKMAVVVGAYGNLVDLKALRRFSESTGIVVILDNAPAFGSTFEGKLPWQFGFGEMVSFHATKVLNSMEGGGIIVDDPEIRDSVIRLRDFGQCEKVRGDVDGPGMNSKMTEVCALVGLRNLDRADFILGTRAKNAATYRALAAELEEQGLFAQMRVSESVHCPYLYFPIILKEEATSFVQHMKSRDIEVRRYYTATHDLQFYRGRYREQDLSFTNEIKDNVVALPLHTMMQDDEIDYLFSAMRDYFIEF
jgi:dTDP-4-amino-4,6-dideoxygalactose transaminase